MPTGVGGERCVVSGCGYSRRAAGRVQTAEVCSSVQYYYVRSIWNITKVDRGGLTSATHDGE